MAVVLIQERKDGLLDRTWVAGVNVTEIIISQVVTQFFILLVQIVLMLVFVLWVFEVHVCILNLYKSPSFEICTYVPCVCAWFHGLIYSATIMLSMQFS